MVSMVSVAEQFVGRMPTGNNPNEVHQILRVMVSDIADSHPTHCTFQQFRTVYQTLEVMVSEITHDKPSIWMDYTWNEERFIGKKTLFVANVLRYLADSSEQADTQIWLTLYYLPGM